MIILDALDSIKLYSRRNSAWSGDAVRDITVLPNNKAHAKSLMEKSFQNVVPHNDDSEVQFRLL